VLRFTLAFWLLWCGGAAAQDCLALPEVVAGELPPIIALEPGETWYSALAAERGCQWNLASVLGKPVTVDDGDRIGTFAGVYVRPNDGAVRLGILDPTGGNAFLTPVPPATIWTGESLALGGAATKIPLSSSWLLADQMVISGVAAAFQSEELVDIEFTSVPAGATIWAGAYEAGETTAAFGVASRLVTSIRLSLAGYRDCHYADGTLIRQPGRLAKFSCPMQAVAP
jgi:hypothetical protein